LSTIFEGFSVSHAAILNGSTGAEEVDGDIYGVRTASLEANTGNYDNTGDDFVLSSWFWIDNATLTVESGYVPFKTMALLSGATVTSSGSAPNDTYSLPLWDETSVNQPTRPVLIRVPSKDSNGLARTMDFILYKVIFAPFSFTGPSYKEGLLLSYSGRAVLSAFDEKGTPLAKRAIGRIINKPQT
jgi:hypothetical protein